MPTYNPLLIKKLEQTLEKEPQSKAFCTLAHIYRSQGEREKAMKLCFEGLIYHPFYAPAYVLLGEIYKDQGLLEKAIHFLNRAKELNPDNPNIYNSLGQIYNKQKKIEKTLNAYKMVLFLKPKDKTALLTVKHLETVLGGQKPEQRPTTEEEKKNQKLIHLQKILARVENYIANHSIEKG